MRYLPYFFLGVFLCGCASSKTKVEQNPLLGTWTYAMTVPDGSEYSGTLTFTTAEGVLAGSMYSKELDKVLPLEGLSFEDGVLVFRVDNTMGSVGEARVVVAGDTFRGTMADVTYNVTGMPFSGARESE